MSLKNLNANKIPRVLQKKITNKKIKSLLKLFEKELIIRENFAVAVSGGPDSMCLIYLLKNWINVNKGSVIALIIDHQLRKESKEESYLIKKYLLSLICWQEISINS